MTSDESKTGYDDYVIHDIKEEGNGKVSLALGLTAPSFDKFSSTKGLSDSIKRKLRESSSTIRRTGLDTSNLDLFERSSSEESPQKLFKKSIKYYYDEDIYGTAIRLLANFSASGFDNDIDDNDIKSFFDTWVFDIGLEDVVEQIFFDFYRVGMVRTYKRLGKFVPRIGIYKPLPKANFTKAAKKNSWSNNYIPTEYTILNPLSIEISEAAMFGKPSTSIKADALSGIKALLEADPSELSSEQKSMLRGLDSGLKKAALSGDSYLLNPVFLGAVDYRKMPYERYPRPRGSNAFETIDYKTELRKADYSTLDGITNYMLLITVGNDEYPVTKQEVIENVAALFNTPSKSFNVVWNHTLQVKKIVSPEIEAILGKAKYEQVNDDYTGALGILRALIDGTGTAGDITLALKSIISEVAYARRQVRRWLYNEYRQVAEAVGFDRIPVVRFNDLELRDEIQMMKTIMALIDRRIISYETGIKRLNYDASTEMARLTSEKDRVADGDFGILGSPYQQSAASSAQPTQRTPKKTPSEGRPVGTGTPKEETTASLSPAAEAYLDSLKGSGL